VRDEGGGDLGDPDIMTAMREVAGAPRWIGKDGEDLQSKTRWRQSWRSRMAVLGLSTDDIVHQLTEKGNVRGAIEEFCTS